MEYPSISLCMIVKNEQLWLEQCLKSIKSITAEMIVVDTGSTDDTVQIAKRFDAHLLTFAWQDDFAAARNFSLQQAKGDWILVLDADEVIAQNQLKMLQELTLDPSKAYLLTQRHYSNDHRLSDFKPVRGEYPEWEFDYGGYFESSLVRLFPNRAGIQYRGKVHELVEHSIKELGRHQIVHSRVILHHYGHTPRARQMREKGELYTPLGEAKLGEDPKDWKSYFELGVEHNVNGKLDESAKALMKAAELNPNYLSTWVNLGYVQCELAMYEQAAKSLLIALKIDPRSAEAFCNLGVVFLRVGQFQKAQQSFINAIKLKPNYVNAYCNLGKALSYQKKLSEAVNVYSRALELLPNCTAAAADLGAIYCIAGMYDKAEHFLDRAIKENHNDSLVLYHLGQVYKATKRTKEAVATLEEFCRKYQTAANAGAGPQQSAFFSQVKAECQALRESL